MKIKKFNTPIQHQNYVIFGAFEMSDTYGFPLSEFIYQCNTKSNIDLNLIPSLADYFIQAIKHGWTDVQIFSKIEEALIDNGMGSQFQDIKKRCITLFELAYSNIESYDIETITKEMERIIE